MSCLALKILYQKNVQKIIKFCISRDQAESLKSKEQTLVKEVGKLNQELEKKDLDKEKVVRRLKKEFQEKEEDWKNKIKGLEEVFETLQVTKSLT